MTEIISIVVPCVSALCAVIGLVVAFFKGRSKKKATSNLNQKDQENILYSYMVEEAKKVQKKAKYFQPTMSKQQVAEEKHDTVMEKVEMYARGANYTWFVKEEWDEKLKKLLSDAKELQI